MRQVRVLLRLQIVEGDALEIGNDQPARHFLFPAGIDETADVFHALGVGFIEILSGGFVLDEDAGRPEKIDLAPSSREFPHGLFEGGDGAALDAEDVEELVPKSLALGFLGGGVPVLA